MSFPAIPLRALAVACALATAACTGAQTQREADKQSAQQVRTPQELIDAVAQLGGTQATRLHPETLRTILEGRESDANLKVAFDAALSGGGKQATDALLQAAELYFIHDPKASALDLLGPELSEHFRQFDWQPADYPGGPEGPNEQFADVMVDALDLVLPERRVNTTRNAVVLKQEATEAVWTYMEAEWVPVPGQEDWKLNRHAKDSFVRMREAAKQDGVDLVILSAHRSRAKAEANAARANNPAAVASFSAHSLGLAVDFQMSQGELKFSEITTRPMAEVVRMRESPVHKWLALRGAEFGWYPYQNEPWHWEYNPPGFRGQYWKNFPDGAPER